MKLAATETDLARVEGLLSSERNALGETERYYAEQKGLMTDDEVQVAGAKHKLAQAKNSKEYMAAQREIEQRREALTSREGEIAKLVEAVDAKKKLLSDRASDVEALKASISKDGDAAKARMAEIQAKIAEQRVERDKLAAEVRPDVLKRYSSIRMRRGLAVVSVRNGTCQGCNMNIPPQLYNVASARPDGRDLSLLPPHHLLGGDHEGRPGLRVHDTVAVDRRLSRFAPPDRRYSGLASRSSRTGGRGGRLRAAVEESPGSAGQGAG